MNKSLFADVCAVLGVILLSVGAWQAWRPLGFMLPGLYLLALATLNAPAAKK